MPLDEPELRELLGKLGLGPAEVLRKRDPTYRKLGLTGSETKEVLIRHLVENPTLLDRPIGVLGDKAEVGRPPDKLLRLVQIG